MLKLNGDYFREIKAEPLKDPDYLIRALCTALGAPEDWVREGPMVLAVAHATYVKGLKDELANALIRLANYQHLPVEEDYDRL